MVDLIQSVYTVQVAAQSRAESGLLVTSRDPNVGLNADLIQHHMQHKFESVLKIDIDEGRAAGNMIMDQLLEGVKGHDNKRYECIYRSRTPLSLRSSFLRLGLPIQSF
ncbi:hypothetical protein F5Y06DRAFT_265317 [Hypoxylon sp. FL0890]|nr:hypothetical protein F5Y06DRAFT_265317 [Hypoxylon sp. FL0890]